MPLSLVSLREGVREGQRYEREGEREGGRGYSDLSIMWNCAMLGCLWACSPRSYWSSETDSDTMGGGKPISQSPYYQGVGTLSL